MSQLWRPLDQSSQLVASIGEACLGGTPVLHDIRLEALPGKWTAIVGPNGAGKSTLLKVLSGHLPCDGEVLLNGQPLKSWHAKARARGLSWLGQAEHGSEDLLAQDVVMLGRLPHQEWLSPPSDADRHVVQQAMEATQCWAWRKRPMGQLSGGERQRVLLARVLAVQAPVMLMDEPLAHLDPPHQADWLDTVRKLCRRGVTVLSVLHELHMAMLADELVIMAKGQVVCHGNPADPTVRAALVEVFERRISLVHVQGRWVPLPVTT
jgi:iron complex transport system ATP-binding protein